MIDAIVAAFLAEPFKSLLGSGGIVGLIVLLSKWWRSRVSVGGQFLNETYNVKGDASIPTEVRIELENLGREPTSVLPTVAVSYLYPRKHCERQSLKIVELDRTLSPVTPRTFTLQGPLPAGYLFSHFRVFRVQFTRGSSVRLRVLNASGESAGALRFTYLKLLFVVFGALPHVEG